jgi:hypothetical protein
MAFTKSTKPKAGGRRKVISEPGDQVQANLFETLAATKFKVFPHVYRTEHDYKRLLNRALTQKYDLGIDLETNLKGIPYALGVGWYNGPNEDGSVGGEAASVPWSDALAKYTIYAVMEAGLKLVAHSAMGADRPWIENKLKIKTPVSAWWCSMLSHYAANMHLTKQAAKEEDDDEGASLGYMNLWSALRCIPLPLYNYKECRGENACFGPCPKHTVFEYNGVDSWGSPTLKYYHQQTFREMQVPDSFIEHLHRMSAVCYAMQRRGIRIDRQFLSTFDTIWQEEIKKLESTLPFNPRSPKAVQDHFDALWKDLTVDLRPDLSSTNKDILADILEDLDESIPGYKELTDLLTFKMAGKGSKSWFDPKYFSPDKNLLSEEEIKTKLEPNGEYWWIHPRFNNTGTATLRLACSKPNAMNIPSRGALRTLRKAIVPPAGYKILKADAKQLEVRIAVYHTGTDPTKVLVGDFFTNLVTNGGGKFEEAGAKLGWKPRDVAKRTAHSFTNGQGMALYKPAELTSKRNAALVDCGAIRVFEDWTFDGRIVCFTGSELARKMFGTATDEQRTLVNSLLFDAYLKQVPWILEFQRKVSHDAYTAGYCRGLDGSFLYLDSPILKDNFKASFSKISQGGGAYFIQTKMLQDLDRTGELWYNQAHDEMVRIVPTETAKDAMLAVVDFLEEPVTGVYGLEGLQIPFDSKTGPNWLDLEELTR